MPGILKLKGKTGQSLTDFANPFNKKHVECVSIYIYPKEGYCYGTVEFKNGRTEGKQKFRTDNFEELIRKIEAFIEEIEG